MTRLINAKIIRPWLTNWFMFSLRAMTPASAPPISPPTACTPRSRPASDSPPPSRSVTNSRKRMTNIPWATDMRLTTMVTARSRPDAQIVRRPATDSRQNAVPGPGGALADRVPEIVITSGTVRTSGATTAATTPLIPAQVSISPPSGLPTRRPRLELRLIVALAVTSWAGATTVGSRAFFTDSNIAVSPASAAATR